MREFIINDLEPVAYLVYMAALLFYCRIHKSVRHQVLFIYYLLSPALLYAGFALDENNWSYNLLFLVTICVFSWYFYTLLLSKPKQMIVAFCLALNSFFFIYADVVKYRFFSTFNSQVYGVAFITIVLYALLYLHQLLGDVKQESSLLANFDFWLTCSYLLYFLGSFVIVIYYEAAEPHQRGNIWAIQNGILFICSVITLQASLKLTKKQTAV